MSDGDTGQKLRILVNSETGMSRGKYAAQAVHAALLAVGAHPGVPVVVRGARRAEIEALPTVVRDAGRTEVAPGTVTAGTDWAEEEGAELSEPDPLALVRTHAELVAHLAALTAAGIDAAALLERGEAGVLHYAYATEDDLWCVEFGDPAERLALGAGSLTYTRPWLTEGSHLTYPLVVLDHRFAAAVVAPAETR